MKDNILNNHRIFTCFFIISFQTSFLTTPAFCGLPYTIVDSGQDACYDNSTNIDFSQVGQPYYGQDAQYDGVQPAYKDNGNGTVTDINTGLMWQKTPDLKNKKTYRQVIEEVKKFKLAGYSDWRLPTIKELYSLIDFRGYSMRTAQQSIPSGGFILYTMHLEPSVHC